MEALLVSIGVVALAEMGDKTQLLSLVLAARFRRPLPIILGILAATLLNHALAGAGGAWIAALLGPDVMRWVLGLSFIAMGAWALIPDKLDPGDASLQGKGIFTAAFTAFFLAEMGDKTQIATIALAAKFPSLAAVVMGTTIGMLLANVPVVLLGEKLTAKIPLRVVRALAAAAFVILGIAALVFAPTVR
jgi:Ca2+/H+ antiporter, TMEM165/GDT1 family